MKTFFTTFIFVISVLPLFAQQNISSISDTKTSYNRDSILLEIHNSISNLASMSQKMLYVGKYKVYPTSNIYNSLKLNTATGEVTALQIGIGSGEKATKAMEYDITDAVTPDGSIIGRYELYPTKNNYNFILLDTIVGTAYQVQWSTKASECIRIRLW